MTTSNNVNGCFGDTKLTKVFVGGLAWDTHKEAMYDHFIKYGDILEAVIISDKLTRRSKGYGFVSSFLYLFFSTFLFLCSFLILFRIIFSYRWLSKMRKLPRELVKTRLRSSMVAVPTAISPPSVAAFVNPPPWHLLNKVHLNFFNKQPIYMNGIERPRCQHYSNFLLTIQNFQNQSWHYHQWCFDMWRTKKWEHGHATTCRESSSTVLPGRIHAPPTSTSTTTQLPSRSFLWVIFCFYGLIIYNVYIISKVFD